MSPRAVRQGPEPEAFAASLEGLSPLRRKVLVDILEILRKERALRLVELELARRIGVSRSPVSFALRLLAEAGIVARDGKGECSSPLTRRELDRLSAAIEAGGGEGLYERIAADHISGLLPAHVTEAGLMRRFGVARGALVGALSRARAEGWVERRVGHGWTFLPLMEGADAYAESYEFRLLLEPAAFLLPGFRPDAEGLRALRATQEAIRDGGWRSMGARELFEANAEFHLALASWSGNRFLQEAIGRVNVLRRLVEYRQSRADRAGRRAQVLEHLRILEALEAGDREGAASLLRAHLEGARAAKAGIAAG